MGGASSDPGWYHDMKASPLVELQNGAVRRHYTAQEPTGPEREIWWNRAVDEFAS